MTARTPPTQPFKVLKISGDSSTSLEEIRDKGEEIHADSHESAARIWCSRHEGDFHSLEITFELAIADAAGSHVMFTIEPVCRLDVRRSDYQGLT